MKRKIAIILTLILLSSCILVNIQALSTDTKVPFNMSIVTKKINDDGSVGDLETVFGEKENFIVEFKVDPQKIPYGDIVTGKDKEIVLVVDTSGSMDDEIKVDSDTYEVNADYDLLTRRVGGKEEVIGYIDKNKNIRSGMPDNITILYDKTDWIEAYEKNDKIYSYTDRNRKNVSNKKNKYFGATYKIHFNIGIDHFDEKNTHPGKPVSIYNQWSDKNYIRKIDIAKDVLKTFILQLQEGTNIKISIVEFNNGGQVIEIDGHVFANLDDDEIINKINEIITSLTVDGGTNTGDGLRLAYYNLLNSENNNAEKYIVLLTDGESTSYTVARQYTPGEIIHHEGYYEWIEGTLVWKEGYYESNRTEEHGYSVCDLNGPIDEATWHEGRYVGITGEVFQGYWYEGYYTDTYYSNWFSRWYGDFESRRKENANGRYEMTEGYNKWIEPYDEVIDGKWSSLDYYCGEATGNIKNEVKNFKYCGGYSSDFYEGSEYATLISSQLLANADDNINIETHVIGFDITGNKNNNPEIAKLANNTASDGYYHIANNGSDIAQIYNQIAEEIIKELPLEYIDLYVELPEGFNVNSTKVISNSSNLNNTLTYNNNIITGRISDFKYELNEETMDFEAEPIIIQAEVNVDNEGEYTIGDTNVNDNVENLKTYIQYKDLDNTITHKAFSAISRSISNSDLPEISAILNLKQNINTGTVNITFNDKSIIEILDYFGNTIYTKDFSNAPNEPPYTESTSINLDDCDKENNSLKMKASVYNDSKEETVSTLEFVDYGLVLNETEGQRKIILKLEGEGGLTDLSQFIVNENSVTIAEEDITSNDKEYTVELLLVDGINNITAQAVNHYGNITNYNMELDIDAKLPVIDYSISNGILNITVDEEISKLYLSDSEGNENLIDITDEINEDKISASLEFEENWSDFETLYIKADDMSYNRGSKLVKKEDINDSNGANKIFNNGLFVKSTSSFSSDNTTNVVKSFSNTYGFEFTTDANSEIALNINSNDSDIIIENINNIELYSVDNGTLDRIKNVDTFTKIIDTKSKKLYKLNLSELDTDTNYIVIYDLTVNTDLENTSFDITVSVGNTESSITTNVVDLPILE